MDPEALSLASVYFFAAMTSMRIVMATDEIHGWHEALREWLIHLRTRPRFQKQSQQAEKMGRSNLICTNLMVVLFDLWSSAPPLPRKISNKTIMPVQKVEARQVQEHLLWSQTSLGKSILM